VNEDASKIAYGVSQQLPSGGEFDELAAELRINGYTVLPSGFDAGFIESLKPALERVYAEQVAEIGGEENLRRINDADMARGIVAYDPAFMAVATAPALLRFAKRILGAEILLQIQNGILNRHDRENHQKKWHRDLVYQHFTSSAPLAINALFCVDDFTAENGATFVLPGTQHVEEFPTPAFCRKFEQQVIAPAGSYLILDAMLFHRAGLNRSDSIRRGINHVITLPFFAQHIDVPRMMRQRGLQTPSDPSIAKYLGYRWSPADSPLDWRQRKA
jgi:ectoine hydroxylase-related dioxygenase (phytanoyl-CoA dioxygenase family)